MGDWNAGAHEILAAAVGAGVPVDRSLVAPGPGFARDCKMLAVYLAGIAIARPQARSDLAVQWCGEIPVPTLNLVYVKDCVPAVKGGIGGGTPPTPAAIDAWASEFLDECQTIYNALAALPMDRFGLEQASFGGPGGGIASMTVPVRLTSFG